MQFTGHKTSSIFRCYDTITRDYLAEAELSSDRRGTYRSRTFPGDKLSLVCSREAFVPTRIADDFVAKTSEDAICGFSTVMFTCSPLASALVGVG